MVTRKPALGHRRILFETASLAAVVAIARWRASGEETWTEVVAGIVLVLAYVMEGCSNPLSWLLALAMRLVRDEHWAAFHAGVVARFGDVYEGQGGYFLLLVGYLIFVAMYALNGTLHMLVESFAASRARAQPYKLQPATVQWAERPGQLARSLAVNSVVTLVYVLGMAVHAIVSRGAGGVRIGGPDMLALPSKQEQLSCFLAGMVWNEVTFYYGHRALHHPTLYGRLHKMHHEYTAPFAMAAIYCTPVEMVLANLVPFLGIVSIYRFHIFTVYCWVAGAILGTQAHHAGYRWPWTTIVEQQPNHHDLHHKYFTCNYGNVGWLDALHRTVRVESKSE